MRVDDIKWFESEFGFCRWCVDGCVATAASDIALLTHSRSLSLYVRVDLARKCLIAIWLCVTKQL